MKLERSYKRSAEFEVGFGRREQRKNERDLFGCDLNHSLSPKKETIRGLLGVALAMTTICIELLTVEDSTKISWPEKAPCFFY